MSSLQGKRVVVTRPRQHFERAAHLLEQRGAIPISFPTIRIAAAKQTENVKRTLEQLTNFDWLILTSANGVAALKELLEGRTLPRSLKLAAVGPKTSYAMRMLDWRVDFVPARYMSSAILPGLGDLAGKRILLARGQLAEPDLPEAIRARGGQVTDLVVYRTLPETPDESEWAEIQRGVDALTFTSASTVEHFVHLIKQAGLSLHSLSGQPIFCCIGPVTAQKAKKHGMPVDVLSQEHTLEGLLEALEHFYDKEHASVHP